MNALYAYRQRFEGILSATPGIGAPQLTVGLIEGGTNTNVVPDRVVMRLDRRLIPEEDAAEAEAELRGLVEGAVTLEGARAEVRRVMLAAPLVPTAASERLAAIVARHASAVLGEQVTAHGVPLYTDARFYAERGVPTVLYGAGPHTIEEANAHRADERLPLVVLPRATVAVAAALHDVLTEWDDPS